MAVPAFGFGTGDFIAVLDKIYLVYKKIKSAPGVISELSHQTEVLQGVLEQSKGFLSGTDVPEDQQRLKALKRALKGCTSLVDELNTFVDKYSSLAKENKFRYFQLIKFIRADVGGLKTKVDSHTNLLTLSLSSLSSLSQIKVAKTLEEMAHGYRAGKREPTVISQALDNKPVDQGELLDQVEKDLEDMDVHPVAIQHNLTFIKSWLEKVLVKVGLDEAEPEVKVDAAADGIGLSTGPQLVEEHVALQEEQVDAKTETIELEDNYSNHDKWNGQPDEDIALPLVNDDEDAQSVSSHRSKPDDWRPFDRPDSKYVQEMLAPLFKCNPYDMPQPLDCEHRFKRAFHQADWDGNGHLTRPEVVRLSIEALQRAGADDTDLVDQLQDIVTSFDVDHNKLFNLEEFSNLMLQLIQRSATVRRKKIADDLESCGEEAETLATIRRQEEKKPMLPWGLSRNPSSAELPYYDEISQVHIQSLPKKQLLPSSFSLMALEAEFCIASIETFEQKWLGICPKSLHTEILPALSAVREIARKFTTLENPEHPTVLSDLDSALICYYLAKYEFGKCVSHLKPEIHRLSDVRTVAYSLLRQVQGFTHCLASFEAADIKPIAQDFHLFWRKWRENQIEFYSYHIALFNLTPVEQAVQAARAAVNTFAANSRVVATNNSDSNQLLVASEQLETGQDTTCTTRQQSEKWQCTNGDLQWHAVQSVQTVLKKKAERKLKLQSTPWTGKAMKIEIQGWHRSLFSSEYMFIVIEIDKPEQRFRTMGVQRGASVQWSHLNTPIELFQDSQIKLQVFYEDDDFPDKLKYTTSYSVSDEGVVAPNDYAAFKTRTMEMLNKVAEGGMYDLTRSDENVDYNLWLYINMDNQSEIASEINKLEDMHWTTLLPRSIITTVSTTPALERRTQTADGVNDLSPEETAVGFSPGWSKNRTRNGSVFFINHITGKSTLEDPVDE